MARPIVTEDIHQIEKLVADVVGNSGPLQIERMGGLTNHSYKVQLENNSLYAVRIPGDGTEDMIDRHDEETSTRLACDLGIDAELLYFGPNGAKVTAYIEDAETMTPETMVLPENMVQAARILYKLHHCGVDTQVSFEVFDMAADYERIIEKNHVDLFEDYTEVRQQVMEIKAEIDQLCHPKKVPCHNDPLCANWVQGRSQMYLIDWEYAGMNDGLWDVADVSIEAGYDSAQDEALLRAYFQTETVDELTRRHFTANKIYVDFLWTLWAKTRVPFDGQEMEDWASDRYLRLKQNLEYYRSMSRKVR